MLIPTFVGVLALVINCLGSLLLIGLGLWVWQRVKLPGLPWIITCWIINFPLVALLNSWCLETFIGPRTATKSSPLSVLGLKSIRDFMAWHNLISSAAVFILILLIAAQATLLVHHLKPSANDRLPQFFGPVRTFSTIFGFLAVLLAMANHLSMLLLQWL